MKSLIFFVVAAVVFGAVSLGLGYWLAGDDTLVQGATAFGLAFVPSAGSIAWVVYTYRSDPNMRLLASLGGSGVRMGIALGGGYFLTNTQPQWFGGEFWYWLIWFYLAFLGLEITLLVRQEAKLNETPPG